MIRPSDYETYGDYLDACKQSDLDSGANARKAEFDRGMMEAGGEEYEGQYGGSDGWGPS